MAINFLNLRTNLVNVINTLTSVKVIWSNQNANAPAGDYIAAKITSFRFIGFTDWQDKPTIQEDLSTVAGTQGDREFVLSLQVISENAVEILLDLIEKLNLNSKLELLSSKKLAYVGMDGDIADITVQINNSFETRASVDLVFRISKNYSSETEDEIEIIESVEIAGELNGNALETPVQVDLTIQS